MMVQGVWSDDPASQLEATTQFRKLLSIGIDVVTSIFFLRDIPGFYLTIDWCPCVVM